MIKIHNRFRALARGERQASTQKRYNPTHAVVNWLKINFYHSSEMFSTQVII